MDTYYCDASDAFELDDVHCLYCTKKQLVEDQRRADMKAVFCRLLGVDTFFCHDDILNYYEYFKGTTTENKFYNQRYNEFTRELRNEELRLEHAFSYYSHWFKEKFYVCQPYRDFEGAEGYLQKDHELIAKWNAEQPEGKYCDMLILDAKYSWHYQYHTSLYIIGTADFIAAIQPAIEKYKYYVDKYYSKDI